MSTILDELTTQEADTLESILSKMLTSSDVELKTEINNPLALVKLMTLANMFEAEECPLTAQLIRDFVTLYLKYMVSHKRKSRGEIIQALSELMKKRDMTQKMLGQSPEMVRR